ncbi:hypothetical protein [Streptomyces mirabilis]|uniref:hypothetical protein n=1 Tax=Streptomyces mirabilis TaxID=68239 RepID=UPI003686165A
MGVPPFQFAERVSHPPQRAGAGDRRLQLSARGKPGKLAEHDRARRRTFSVGSRLHPGRGLPVVDRVDPLGPHTQLHGQCPAAVAERVDERSTFPPEA